jgi:plastocyanin
MVLKWVPVVGLVLVTGGWLVVTTALQAQVRGNDANIAMMDNCEESDAGYAEFGGCPEGAPFPGSKSYSGDVTLTEFFRLLFSPLAAPGHVIGHPSWRNEPSYISVRQGQTVRVTNRGGRAHTFTEVAEFGGGFVPPLNGSMTTAPECSNPEALQIVPYGGSQAVTGLKPGLHKFQCCIHPWMRGAVRVN